MNALESAVTSERRVAQEAQERFRKVRASHAPAGAGALRSPCWLWQELNARYERMLAELEERARSHHSAHMRRVLEEVDERQRLEMERAGAVEAAREEAYEAAQKHFREMVRVRECAHDVYVAPWPARVELWARTVCD